MKQKEKVLFMNQFYPGNYEEEDLEAIRRGLEQSLAGEGRPADEFFREFEENHRIGKPLEKKTKA